MENRDTFSRGSSYSISVTSQTMQRFSRLGSLTVADLYAGDIMLYPDSSIFSVFLKSSGKSIGTLSLKMPGIHNILNALAAIAVALDLDIPLDSIATAIASFKGIDRRFTHKGTYKEADIFDDYGHHPVEIHHTLAIARNRTQKKLTVLFQPHRYTRTYHLWNDFIKTLTDHPIDHLLITDIYAASESAIPGIESEQLVKAIKVHKPSLDVRYIPFEENFASLHKELDSLVEPGDLILLLGAGKVNKLAEKLQNTNNQ